VSAVALNVGACTQAYEAAEVGDFTLVSTLQDSTHFCERR
jgi:hypothetical protein